MIKDIAHKLRVRLIEYRYARINSNVSVHINGMEIALCLVEYQIETGRAIYEDDEGWFRGGLYIAQLLENSEWEDLYLLYKEMCEEVKDANFFRK